MTKHLVHILTLSFMLLNWSNWAKSGEPLSGSDPDYEQFKSEITYRLKKSRS